MGAHQFDIEAGDARATLSDFSKQAGLQLLFDYDAVSGIKTHEVRGRMEPTLALKTLIAGTKLSFLYVNDRTVKVFDELESADAAARNVVIDHRDHPGSAQIRNPGAGMDGLEQVTVEGARVRGSTLNGERVITLDHDLIDESSQHTIADFLKTLPQTFGGGPTEDTVLGQEARSNTTFGSGFNVIGLGARTTLVLVNGRRIGTGNEFTDLSSLPLAAVSRIDALPYGSIAAYGADATGAVMNFITRSGFTGGESDFDMGTGTQSALRTLRVAQTLGCRWDEGASMVSAEFYRSSGLPASDRSYTVSDLRPFGGSNFDTEATNPGNLIVDGTIWAIPHGQNGANLSPNSFVPGTANLQNRYDQADVIPRLHHWSLLGTAQQRLSDTVDLFAEVILSNREARKRSGGFGALMIVPSTNAFYVNPVGGAAPVALNYNFGPDLGPETVNASVGAANITLGMDIAMNPSWDTSLYGTYAREKQRELTDGDVNFAALYSALASPDPLVAFNPFGDGSNTNPRTLNRIRGGERIAVDTGSRSVSLKAEGRLVQMPAGSLKLAMGSEFRDQIYRSVVSSAGTAVESNARLSRRIVSTFGGLSIPLFSERNSRVGLQGLQLSMSGRYDSYGNFGSAVTPAFGIAWEPASIVTLRGSWSKSFRVPSLEELDESRDTVIPTALGEGNSTTGLANVLVWSGRNALLRAERATSWTAGMDLRFERIEGLSVGLTYFNIEFPDRIEETLLTPDILNDPRFASVIVRNPSRELLQAACSHGAAFDCLRFPVAAIIDLRPHNAGTLRTNGLDFGGRYELSNPYGQFVLRLDGTYLFEFSQQDGKTSPRYDVLSTQNNPINLKLRASLRWEIKGLESTGVLNFANSYRDTASYPARSVSSSTTYDMVFGYDIATRGTSWLEHTRIELSAVNLFNQRPPFLNNRAAGIGYDQENADPNGRLLSVRIRKIW